MRAMIEYGALIAVVAFAVGTLAIAAKGLSGAGVSMHEAVLEMVARWLT